jgi:DNA-binding response OmpR family regulator
MMFHAILVSKDDEAAAKLNTVLSRFGIASSSCGYTESVGQLRKQKFDAVVVDFDDPQGAAHVLRNLHPSPDTNGTVTVALLRDKTKVREVFGQGAHFILYKPFSISQAEASLRAVKALVMRERRSSSRVPLQLPIQLKWQGKLIDGILLDLSETGMDILAAQPLRASSPVTGIFKLPAENTELELRGEAAWANPNGEAGVQFIDLPEKVQATLKQWIAANAPEAPPPDTQSVTNCKLTDLTLGGCYVETESPFPESSGITLCLRADKVEVEVDGKVRVAHPGFGMGIEFASRTAEERAQVEKFIGFLTARPGLLPDLSITPRALTTADSAPTESQADPLDDPLLELLSRHESLNQEEFLEELRRQRS